jgi:hypothetical protein
MEEQEDIGGGGALVADIKKQMQQDEDETQKEAENAGPKIKMNKIGGRKKAGAASTKAAAAPGAKSDPVAQNWSKNADKNLSAGGFSEQDIEFMKKAI